VSSRDDQARPPGSTGPVRRPTLTRPHLPASLPGEPGRLVGRRRGGERPPTDPLPPSEPPVGERLAAARERKGVDLHRAERDTKIRIRYLAALERGDFRDLPGAVYTKGFLRNYAIYLGLDPEDVLRQWRRERGEGPTEPMLVVPTGLEAPRQALTIGRGTIIAVLLAIGVIVFAAYLVVQLVRFSQHPNVAVTDPLSAVTQVDPGATVYTLRGTSLAGATVSIDTPGRETVRVTAGSDGRWSPPVDLIRGRNQFDVTATDPATGKTSASPVTVYITVPLAGTTTQGPGASVASTGASVVVVFTGGSATLKAWVDGVLDPRTGDAGRAYADGKTVTFTGTKSVELRTSDASVTYVTVNGTDLGQLSKASGPGTWLFAPPKPPQRTQRQ
jgi:cytoskeletal protein RodZ